MDNDPSYLDGNAAGGPLREVFAVDVTTAVGRCEGCGRTGPVAEARVYGEPPEAPGMVVRCPGCDGVLMRFVRSNGRAWLDLRGMTYLQLALS